MSDRESTHSEECYKWHHQCAIARINRLESAWQDEVLRADKNLSRSEKAEERVKELEDNAKKALKALDTLFLTFAQSEGLQATIPCQVWEDCDGEDCLEIAWHEWEQARKQLEKEAKK